MLAFSNAAAVHRYAWAALADECCCAALVGGGLLAGSYAHNGSNNGRLNFSRRFLTPPYERMTRLMGQWPVVVMHLLLS